MKKLILLLIFNLLPLSKIDSQGVDPVVYETPSEYKYEWYHPITLEEDILHRLVSVGIDSTYAKFIVCQAIFESGWFKNSLTVKHNNVFARHHGKLDQYSLGAGGRAEGHSKFARYKSIPDAVLSQVDYFDRKGYSYNWKSIDQFAKELKQKGYYEASESHYARGLKTIYNKLYGTV